MQLLEPDDKSAVINFACEVLQTISIVVAEQPEEQLCWYHVKRKNATIKLTLFTVSKDEWNTKEDNGKNILYAVCEKALLRLNHH